MATASQLCVLCGVNQANPDKREHIPSRGMFTQPMPNDADLITVPACSDCNHGTSTQDQEFQACLSLAVGCSTDDQRKLWRDGQGKGSIRRSLQKNKKLQKRIVSSFKEHEVQTPSGLYVGQAATFSWNVQNHNKAIEKITRGLFFHVTQKILSPDASIHVDVWPQAKGFPQKLTTLMNGKPVINKCGTQFVCQYGICTDVEDASFWLYQFYESHFVSVATKPAERA